MGDREAVAIEFLGCALTGADVAAALGVTPGHWSRIVAGERPLSGAAAAKLFRLVDTMIQRRATLLRRLIVDDARPSNYPEFDHLSLPDLREMLRQTVLSGPHDQDREFIKRLALAIGDREKVRRPDDKND